MLVFPLDIGRLVIVGGYYMDTAQCVTAFKERQTYISVCFFKIEGYLTAGIALRINVKNYSVLLVG